MCIRDSLRSGAPGAWPARRSCAPTPLRPGHPPRSNPEHRAAVMNTPGDPLDIAILQSRGRRDLRRGAFGTDDIYPIQHQHVEMRIQIQRTAKALLKGHRATTGIRISLHPCLLAISSLDHAEKYRQKCTEEPAIVGQAITDLYRQADNPLPHRTGRHDLVAQPRRRRGHPPPHTAGAETAPLTRKRHRAAGADLELVEPVLGFSPWVEPTGARAHPRWAASIRGHVYLILNPGDVPGQRLRTESRFRANPTK